MHNENYGCSLTLESCQNSHFVHQAALEVHHFMGLGLSSHAADAEVQVAIVIDNVIEATGD